MMTYEEVQTLKKSGRSVWPVMKKTGPIIRVDGYKEIPVSKETVLQLRKDERNLPKITIEQFREGNYHFIA